MTLENEKQDGYARLLQAMKKQSDEDKIFLRKALKSIEELNLHNSIYAQLLIQTADLLKNYTIYNVDAPAAELELDRDKGMGINLHKAINALDDYTKPKVILGQYSERLDDALLAIFREKERRILNEI